MISMKDRDARDNNETKLNTSESQKCHMGSALCVSTPIMRTCVLLPFGGHQSKRLVVEYMTISDQ